MARFAAIRAYSARSVRPALVLFVVLVCGFAWRTQDPGWELATPAPAVAFKPDVLAQAKDLACAACHAEVVQEWSVSAHALSWVDEVYQEELQGRKRPELCQACHIPAPLLLAGSPGRPVARPDARELGITCEACHLGPGGTMLGPRGGSTPAHPTQASEHLSGAGSNALCSACHSINIGPVVGVAKDFASSKQAERGRSCVGCHMAVTERPAASAVVAGTGGESESRAAGARPGRSHLLQTPRDPAFLRRAFEASLELNGSGAKVVLKNRAGHRVPGLIGREITFEAQALGSGGDVLARGNLKVDAQSYVPVDGQVEIALEKAGVEVHLVGRHLDPRSEDEPLTFLDQRLKAAGR